MSYCVNCGVKLAPSERKCPLCGCPVNNPMNPFDPRIEKPYQVRRSEQDLRVTKATVLTLTAVLMLVPAVICLLIDWAVASALTWSLYPAGALLMLFITAAGVLLGGRNAAFFGILAGDTSLCLYLWLVQQLSGGGVWLQAVVFPVLLLVGVMALAMVASVHQRVLKGLAIPAVALLLIALTVLAVDLLITVTLTGSLRLSWSVYVMIPCGVIAIMLLIIHHSAPLRNQLKRTLHL